MRIPADGDLFYFVSPQGIAVGGATGLVTGGAAASPEIPRDPARGCGFQH